jgi:hypothetical protein
MSPRLRIGLIVLLVAAVAGVAAILSLPSDRPFTGISSPSGQPGASAQDSGSPTLAPTPTPRPAEGGTELYGYLPYWQVTDSMAAYLHDVPATTLAMFSVSARRNGAVDSRAPGYKKITSELGRRIISDAHARGARVELVFTSFGATRNGIFFGRLAPPAPGPTPAAAPSPGSSALPSESAPPSEPPWHRTVDELTQLSEDLGVDGINVDVERLDELDRAAYAEFLGVLRSSLRAVAPKATLTVATEAGLVGAGNAAAAAQAGVDRIFLMGYDYHWSGSQPGASSPVDRSDGLYTLRWSIDQYVEAGVPRDHILLGLPLYGMTWQTVEPGRSAQVIGTGSTWVPSRHLDVLLDPGFRADRDPLEISEFFVRPEGDAWRLTYYDSPATLRAKLALARDQGLAGGGFWAIGYERGLPGYVELMRDFRNGKITRSEAPPAPSPIALCGIAPRCPHPGAPE